MNEKPAAVQWVAIEDVQCEVAQMYRPDDRWCRVRGRLYVVVLSQSELFGATSRPARLVCGVHLAMLRARGMVARAVPLAGSHLKRGGV